MDARTASSGSSVWEGQLQSLVLSEYASTEMSLHALYMHQVSAAEGRVSALLCLCGSTELLYSGAGVKTGLLCVALAVSGTHSVDQAGLELTEIHLPLPPECWN